jgi:lipopolysaccharide heptosyltransferase II
VSDKRRLHDNIRNILVFNVNWLGDVVFSSPVFIALKAEYPDSKITCIVHPRVKDIASSIPAIDEIVVFDERGVHRSVFAKAAFVRKLKGSKFNVAFILRGSFSRSLLLWLSGIPLRYGYARKGWGWLLTGPIFSLDKNKHRSDQYLEVIEKSGIEVKDRSNSLYADETLRVQVRELLSEKGWNGTDRLVALNCGGNWDLKRWPEDQFSTLVRLIMELPGIQLVMSGAKNDIELIRRIVTPLERKPIITAGLVDIKGMVALFSLLDVLISNDSGPLHVANALGVNVIGLFGPTRPELTGPRGKGDKIILMHDISCNSHACYSLKCSDNICMKKIKVDEVFAAVNKLLNDR